MCRLHWPVQLSILRGRFTNGLYTNGMGQAGQNGYPIGLMNDRGIQYAPRLGIAYPMNEKTVIRSGFGVFYDRFQGNDVFDMLTNPPATVRPTFWYGNLASLGSQQASSLHRTWPGSIKPDTYRPLTTGISASSANYPRV